mmetsp:Transcript_14420/g.36024  ORF Transcript_14420/g.36024 Transcript_14420/m.36024 type:complete len:243 (-) Transcript_14420:2657-3385(-)
MNVGWFGAGKEAAISAMSTCCPAGALPALWSTTMSMLPADTGLFSPPGTSFDRVFSAFIGSASGSPFSASSSGMMILWLAVEVVVVLGAPGSGVEPSAVGPPPPGPVLASPMKTEPVRTRKPALGRFCPIGAPTPPGCISGISGDCELGHGGEPLDDEGPPAPFALSACWSSSTLSLPCTIPRMLFFCSFLFCFLKSSMFCTSSLVPTSIEEFWVFFTFLSSAAFISLSLNLYSISNATFGL